MAQIIIVAVVLLGIALDLAYNSYNRAEARLDRAADRAEEAEVAARQG